MDIDLINLRKEKLLTKLLEEAKQCLSDTLLETCGDQEYRLCLLELGINN